MMIDTQDNSGSNPSSQSKISHTNAVVGKLLFLSEYCSVIPFSNSSLSVLPDDFNLQETK